MITRTILISKIANHNGCRVIAVVDEGLPKSRAIAEERQSAATWFCRLKRNGIRLGRMRIMGIRSAPERDSIAGCAGTGLPQARAIGRSRACYTRVCMSVSYVSAARTSEINKRFNTAKTVGSAILGSNVLILRTVHC